MTPDARNLTDRELLLQTYERTQQIHSAVFGPPSLASRLDILETRVGMNARKADAGVAGLATAVVLAILESLRRLHA